jgi:DNA repair protein RecO (recombination protein O)
MRETTFYCSGIVLKRTNFGETDRIINLLTRERGHLACLAKGVRKLNSSKRALLEPGNYIKGFFVATKGWPIMTQAKIISDCKNMQQSLKRYRELSQLLEILEKLFVEEELDHPLFNQVLELRKLVVSNQAAPELMRAKLGKLITTLGFQHPTESRYNTISEYIEALSDRPVRSYDYLVVK